MKTIKQIAQDLKQAISDREQKLALDLFRAGLQQSEAEFVGQLRKLGVLRCSNYDFQSQILNSLINETGKINISPDSQVYFKSIKSLLSISRNIQTLFKILLEEVDNIEIKSYLVAVDSLFWLLYDLQQDQANGYSVLMKEELALAFSSYLYHSHHKKAIEKSKINKVNEKRLNSKYYIDKLKDFNKIFLWKEIEVLVDHFRYTVTQNDAKVIVKAPDENFDMSLRLGYERHSLQEKSDFYDFWPELIKKNPSIWKKSQAYYQKFKESTFKIIDSPLKHIIMLFSEPQIIRDIVGNKSLFLEEEMMLQQIERNLFLGYQKVNKIKVYKSLSLFDIIKLQRLFAFMFFVFREYISSNKLFKSKLFWRSVLPVFQANELKEFLAIFFGKEKAKEICELFTWRLESNKIFDLQTYPFINIEDGIVLPLGILTNSDLCRNVLQSTGFRFDSESSEDPIVLEMERCLKPVSSIFETNLKYSFEGTKGEVDVLAVVDNCLFIFECKNSLHPCNMFELRTTYDYIQKAAIQLTRFQNLWQQEPFRRYLATKIKTHHHLPSQLCSCIVTGNRMFSGLREQGHSVRPIQELCNIISKGEILLNSYNIYDQDAGKKSIIKFKLWKEDQLKAEDLLGYIQEDSLHKCYFNSLIRIEPKIKLKNKSLVQESYAFSHERFLEQLVDNFRFTTENL